MKKIIEKIWDENEYSYKAAYGFVPNIRGYIHDEDDSYRDCMLVVPGGGYCMCVPHEGWIPAKVFYEQGMNVFVLTYTSDITMSVPLKKQPLEDISRAVRFIRKNDEQYNIKDKKLVICGFSAGAHVCGNLAVHFGDVEDVSSDFQKVSNRPDGVILSYPVVTTGEKTHIYSVQTLLGNEPTEEELEFFSIEKNVTENTPPCFIWQTATDELVPVENSYLMAEALREKKVNYAHYVFPTGFHGLSVPNEDFFRGFAGEDVGSDWSDNEYTMEQVMRAVDAVKKGEGVDVCDRRVQELKDQFPDPQDNPSTDEKKEMADEPQENPFVMDTSFTEDVGLWPELAKAWIQRL